MYGGRVCPPLKLGLQNLVVLVTLIISKSVSEF